MNPKDNYSFGATSMKPLLDCFPKAFVIFAIFKKDVIEVPIVGLIPFHYPLQESANHG